MTIVSIYAVFADQAEADRISMTLVEEKLAACVNILQPCRSIYRWEGAIETTTETPAIIKTALDRADAVIARITEMHSYSVPAIAVWPIERLPREYAEWAEESTKGETI